MWEQLALDQPGGWDAVLRVRGLTVARLTELAGAIAAEVDPVVRYGWTRFAQQQESIPQEAIHTLLRDDDRLVRRGALAAVVARRAASGDDSNLIALAHALTHTDALVAAAAAEVLGLIGDDRAVPDLIGAFRTRDVVVGAAVAEALGRCGDRVAIPWLIAAIRQPFCKSSALVALGNLGDGRSRGVIQDALEDDDPTVRSSACRALSLLPHDGSSLRLRTLLLDPEAAVRLAAALALYHLNERAPLEQWR
jgi:HEAT repeat protein